MIFQQGLSTHDIHAAAINQANMLRQSSGRPKTNRGDFHISQISKLGRFLRSRRGYTIAYDVNNSFTDITFNCVWIPFTCS